MPSDAYPIAARAVSLACISSVSAAAIVPVRVPVSIAAPALKPITAPDPEPPSPLKESGAHVVQVAYKLERFGITK